MSADLATSCATTPFQSDLALIGTSRWATPPRSHPRTSVDSQEHTSQMPLLHLTVPTPTPVEFAHMSSGAADVRGAHPSTVWLQPWQREEYLATGQARNLATRLTWSEREDALIVASVRELGCQWRIIAARLPHRSDDSIRNRWKRIKDLPLYNGGHQPLPLQSISSNAPRLTSCAEEKPERLSWSITEDETIVRSVNELGHKWQKIALRLPGRTAHAIRNRFSRLQAHTNRAQFIAADSLYHDLKNASML